MSREQKRLTREKEQAIRETEQLTRLKEQLTREKEHVAREKEQEKEQVTREKEEVIREKEEAIREKERATREKEEAIREKEQVTREKEEAISDWLIRREEVELTDEVIGRGGWGVVKVAKFRGLRVAAKFLYNSILSDHNRQLFSREMMIAAKIRHPNLLLFIGASRQGESFILTELMPTSLRRELKKRSRVITQLQITSIAQDVACALRYLHQWRPSAIIHCDISSANVLLEPIPNGWRAKICDYGSANFMNAIKTVAPGSPAYAAPEARYPDQHSPKMDTFSYGVLLIEMCVRELPGSNQALKEAQILQIQWPAMVSLVRRCIIERPADRPSMRDIMELLGRSDCTPHYYLTVCALTIASITDQ